VHASLLEKVVEQLAVSFVACVRKIPALSAQGAVQLLLELQFIRDALQVTT
jgi:hypothetical protein